MASVNPCDCALLFLSQTSVSWAHLPLHRLGRIYDPPATRGQQQTTTSCLDQVYTCKTVHNNEGVSCSMRCRILKQNHIGLRQHRPPCIGSQIL